MLLLPLLACTAAQPTLSPVEDGLGADTSGDAADGDAADTADTAHADTGDTPAEEAPPRCPTGMALVSGADGAFCIDAYEALVEDGVARSAAGTTPTVGITYDEAVAACEATPVLGDDGVPVGWKRMPTAREWEDATDGVLGEGGTAYPYGDVYEEGVCATLDAANEQVWFELLPTGSLPRCVSAFGAYDLVGNAWEWTDSGLRIDVAAWFAARAAENLTVEADASGDLRVPRGEEDRYTLQIAGLGDPVPQADADGYLQVQREAVEGGFGAGYLMPGGWAAEAEDFLPVVLVETHEAAWYRVRVRAEDDGATVPDKRGCAYYAGGGPACTADAASLTHTHDFDGTIAARCAADPI